MLYTGVAYAMGQMPGGGAGGAGGIMQFLPIILIVVIFYFLLWRPQRKQLRMHQDFINNLKVGDRVVTSGGVHGEVKGLTETTITLEIAEKVRVKVSRGAISGAVKDAIAPEANKPS